MGVITLEKHIFYLEAKPQETTPQVPNKFNHVPRQYNAVHLHVEHVRVPWEGEKARSLLYMHDDQIGGERPNTRLNKLHYTTPPYANKDIDFMRRYLLGSDFHVLRGEATPDPSRLKFQHKKLLVADIAFTRQIMTCSEIASFLLRAYAASRRQGWLADHPAHLPHNLVRDAWLPFDPTQPGRKWPKRDVWIHQARSWIPKMEGRAISTFIATIDRKTGKKVYDTRNVVPLGIAYRLRYYTGEEPSPEILNSKTGTPVAAWSPRIRSRVNDYLTQVTPGSSSVTEWYAMGRFELPDQILHDPERQSPFVLGYQGARLGPLKKGETAPYKRMFKVTGRDMEEARKNAEQYMSALVAKPETQLHGYKLINAWERGGRKVLNRRGWDLIRGMQR